MKRILIIATALMCGLSALSAEKKTMTLDEAREKIAAIIADPEKTGEVVGQLSAADQNAFLAELNKAISTMPGSNEAKTAKFLAVDREVLLNAQKGNLQTLVATMFATVTLESLTVMAERYGDDLFNRAADATKTFTDEQFTEIASSTVGEVKKRCDGLADSAPRDTLAVYLFERASNFSIPELEDTLLEIAISDPQVRSVAKTEWLAAAKGEGEDRFSALLGYADAGRAPNVDIVLRLTGPQLMTAMLTDLANGVTDKNGKRINPITVGENPGEAQAMMGGPALTDKGIMIIPKTSYLTRKWNPAYTRSDAARKVKEAEAAEEYIKKKEEDHPGGYQDQD